MITCTWNGSICQVALHDDHCATVMQPEKIKPPEPENVLSLLFLLFFFGGGGGGDNVRQPIAT